MRSVPALDARATFPVLSRFFEFWDEVEALRRQLHVHRQTDETLPLVARGREQLAETLRRQQLSAGQSPGSTPLRAVEEAQYVMAATADELFIGLDWAAGAAWMSRPLEVELFGTRRAGEEVFARIDRLLNGLSPATTERAALYLTALELGFKGKLGDAGDREALDGYESRLRELVYARPAPAGPIVPECYAHTTVAGSGLRLPASRMWWSAAGATVALFFLVLLITLMQFRGSPLEDERQRLETKFGQLAGWK